MKNNKNTSIYTRVIDEELTKHIETQDKIYVATHKKTAQKLSVLKFEELPKTNKISDYIGGLVKDYQRLVDFSHLRLNKDLHIDNKDSLVANKDQAHEEIDRKIQETDNKLNPLKGNFSTSGKENEPKVKKYYVILPLLCLIGGIELVANFEIFSTLGGGLISSFAIGVLTAICIFWYAHFSPKIIRKYGGENRKKQLLIFVGLLIPIALLFYIFSSMRIAYLLALNPEMAEVLNSNPWTYTLINVFAYLISVWIVWEFKPTQEEMNAYKKYRRDLKEIEELETEKASLLEQKSALNPKLRETLREHYALLLLGKQTERDIETRMYKCFEEFKLELYLTTNGRCAPLFSGNTEKDLPKLQFNYQNITKDILS